MAGNGKVDKKLASSLPVTTVDKNKKKAPPFPTVQLVCLWALVTAGIFVGSGVLADALVQHHIHLPSWMLPRPGSLTGAGLAEESAAIMRGQAWCSATQAAAAALALLLLLPAGRRALACVALAAAATNHLMFARGIGLSLAADPGCVFFWIGGAVSVLFLAAGDIVCLALLVVPSAEQCAQHVVDHCFSFS